MKVSVCINVSLSLVVFVSFAQIGCMRSGSAIEIPTTIQVPTLLVSEVQAAEDRQALGDCLVEIKNQNSRQQEVKLLRTGCSCYGVSLDGRRLANGEVFAIPADSTLPLRIRFQPQESNSEKSYTADFEAVTKQGKSSPVSVQCKLKVLTDLRLTPSVVTLEALPDQPISQRETLLIEHVYRSDSGEAPALAFSQLPDAVKVEELKKLKAAEEVEPGIWRQTWSGVIQIDAPAGEEKSLHQVNFKVVAPAGENSRTVSGTGHLMVHSRQRVVFPNRVHFGKVPVGASRSKRILLTSMEDSLFRLDYDPALLPDNISIHLSTHSDTRHLVDLTASPKVAGPFSEVIKLTTNMYDVEEISIRVEGLAVAAPSPTSGLSGETGVEPRKTSSPDEANSPKNPEEPQTIRPPQRPPE